MPKRDYWKLVKRGEENKTIKVSITPLYGNCVMVNLYTLKNKLETIKGKISDRNSDFGIKLISLKLAEWSQSIQQTDDSKRFKSDISLHARVFESERQVKDPLKAAYSLSSGSPSGFS